MEECHGKNMDITEYIYGLKGMRYINDSAYNAKVQFTISDYKEKVQMCIRAFT